MKKITQKELKKKIEGLGEIDHEAKMKIICSLIGHSRISTLCFGYRYCGRCGQEVGDSLGSIDSEVINAVIIGHNCDFCKVNYKKCNWRDKLYCKDPFSDKEYKNLPYLKVL